MISENKYRNTEREEQDEKDLEALRTPKQPEEKEEDKNLTPEEKTWKKRHDDGRRYIQQLQKEWAEKEAELKRQLEEYAQKDFRLPKSEEEIAEWEQKFPDIAKTIDTYAIKRSRESEKKIEEKLKVIEERERTLARQEAYRSLLEIHPDFDEIKDTKEFQEWVQKQPRRIIDSLYKNETDYLDAARSIDLYKLDSGMVGKRKDATQSNDLARHVRTPSSDAPETNRLKFTESSVIKMSDADYDKYKPEIHKAMRDPAFYDISGAAR